MHDSEQHGSTFVKALNCASYIDGDRNEQDGIEKRTSTTQTATVSFGSYAHKPVWDRDT